jgi:hypothetical protein
MRNLKLSTFLFLTIITLCGIINLFNTNKSTISELENRALQQMPEFSFHALYSGSYFCDIESFFSDTFVFRDNFVLVSHDLREALALAKQEDFTAMAYNESTEVSDSEDASDALEADNDDSGSLAPGIDSEDSGNTLQNAYNNPNSDNTGSNSSISTTDTTESIPNPSDTDSTTSDSNSSENTGNSLGDTASTVSDSNSPAKAATGENITEASTTDAPILSKTAEKYDKKNIGFWLPVKSKMTRIFSFRKDKLSDYARILNLYSEKLGDKVKIYSVIPPETGEYLRMKKYPGITDSQNESVDYLNSLFRENVKAVDAYGILNRHKDEYVYFRSDHHWTMRGAYYAYTALMNLKGEAPTPLEKYEVKKVEGFLGSIYRNTLKKSLKDNPDTVELFMPFTTHQFFIHRGKKVQQADVLDMKYAARMDKYPIFLSTGGGDWSVMKTNVTNGKKILVIKTSFGNPFSPLLMSNYEEVYTVDCRFYNKSTVGKNIVQFIKDHGIQEVVYLIYIGDICGNIVMPQVEKLLK